MFRLLTDFNDIDANDIVTGLDRSVSGPRAISIGDRVLLHDDGEHEAWGLVTGIQGHVVSARLDWDTWGPAGRYRVLRYGGWLLVTDFAVAGAENSGRGSVPIPRGRAVAV